MYRVFDTKRREWVKDKVYLTQNEEVYVEKKTIFGWKRLVNDSRYVYHRDINMYDKNKKLIYEGDFLKCKVDKDKFVIGIVVFAPEISAYIILSDNTDEWFSLGSDVTEFTEVIGNVFDRYKGKDYGESTL